MERLARDKAAIQQRAASGDADAAVKLQRFNERYELLRINYIADEKLEAVIQKYEAAAKAGDTEAKARLAYLRDKDNRAKERATLVAKLQVAAQAAAPPPAPAAPTAPRPDADLVKAALSRLDALYAQAAGQSGAALQATEEAIRQLEFQAGLSPAESQARRAKAAASAGSGEDPRDKILDELVLRLIPEILAQDSAAAAA